MSQKVTEGHKKGFKHSITQSLLKLDFVFPKQVGNSCFKNICIALVTSFLKEIESNNSET